MLTGWLGQLSLGQMAFAGLGALFAARLVEAGVPFWLAIAATTIASAMVATISSDSAPSGCEVSTWPW